MSPLTPLSVEPGSVKRPYLGIALFFLIAFGLPWAMWIHLRQTMPLDRMFDSFSTYWFTAAPSLAGFIAAFAEGGWANLRRFAGRVFRPPANIGPWLAAFALPLIAGLLTFATHPGDLMQGGVVHWARVFAPVSLLNFFTGPIAEEFGWRGYLFGWLSRYSQPIWVGLMIGPIWAAWHVPLFYDTVFSHPISAISFIGSVTAWSVMLSFVVTKARGSVLPCVLCHWTINSTPAFFFALLPLLPGEKQPGGIAFSVANIVVALIVIFVWRHKLAARPTNA